MVLVEYMRIDNLRLIDFFQYLDTNSRERLSKSDFRDGVANLCLPLTEHHLDLVMEKVDLKKDGYVDLEEFMTVHREVSRQSHSEQQRPDPKGRRTRVGQPTENTQRNRRKTKQIPQREGQGQHQKKEVRGTNPAARRG
uniref:Calmodulin-like protein 3 isoform X2 n=1 Tax=Crassostrea virginica TaxID=6565 RepID=A0A8B8DFF1_CRAVI|nr:calmodulin-like protein 3 isoform X2 [Crassostrea virginica]